MATTTLAATSFLGAPSCVTDRSSSSSFLDSSLRLPPIRSRAPTSVFCSAAAAEESNGRRNVLASIVTTGAALAVFTSPSFAAIGPGTSGAERTAQKADELLQSADKLNVQDAPKRFSASANAPLQEAEKVAQNAGSGPISDLQEGIKNIFGQGQDKASEAQKSAQDVVSQGSGGGLFDSVQQSAQDVKQGVEKKDADAKKTLESAESTFPK